MPDTIFQASDLANQRTEFLETARHGRALLRYKDGTSLVMLPESALNTLEALAQWSTRHLRLEDVLRRGVQPSVPELGELAWLRVFDHEELIEFRDELHEALIASYADFDTDALDACVDAWHTTARQLDDPLRRSVLRGSLAPSDLVEVTRPDAG